MNYPTTHILSKQLFSIVKHILLSTVGIFLYLTGATDFSSMHKNTYMCARVQTPLPEFKPGYQIKH